MSHQIYSFLMFGTLSCLNIPRVRCTRWIKRSRVEDQPGQLGETPSLPKKYKISWVWWHMSVIPATRETEAGELLEPRRWRLQWAEIAPLHSSLGNKSKTPSQKNKQQKKKQTIKPLWLLRIRTYILYSGQLESVSFRLQSSSFAHIESLPIFVSL